MASWRRRCWSSSPSRSDLQVCPFPHLTLTSLPSLLGCHLRDRILSENTELQPSVLQRFHPQLLPASGAPQETVPSISSLGKRCSKVYLFLDLSQPLCCVHKTLLLSNERPRSETVDSSATNKHMSTTTAPLNSQDRSAALMRDILLHIFEMDFYLRESPANRANSLPDDPLGLVSKDPNLVIGWYCRAMNITETAKTLPTAPVRRTNNSSTREEELLACTIPGGLAKMYRESKLGELLSEICPDRLFPPRRSKDEASRSPKKYASRPSSLAFPVPIDEIHSAGRVMANLQEPDDESEALVISDDEDEQRHSAPSDHLQEPLSFGLFAPSIPEMTFQVRDVSCLLGGFSPDDFAPADRLDTMAITNGYSTLRNDMGYVHFVQDTQDLFRMVTEALREQQELSRDGDDEGESNEMKGGEAPPVSDEGSAAVSIDKYLIRVSTDSLLCLTIARSC
jgi:hypothetical protein